MQIVVEQADYGLSNITINFKNMIFSDCYCVNAEIVANNEQIRMKIVDKILQRNNIYKHNYLEQQANENKASFKRLESGLWEYRQDDWSCTFKQIANTIYAKQIL